MNITNNANISTMNHAALLVKAVLLYSSDVLLLPGGCAVHQQTQLL